jgi:hypothetical protein
MIKTELQQVRISDVKDALKYLTQNDDVHLPLVLVPDERSCCACMMSIPSGVHCIMHRFGKDTDPDALAPAGLQICKPACYRVAYCVSQSACTYNAPVKSCPTADNVMVDCDLTLVFVIGPGPRDVKQFVYKLGARRFDDFLYAAVEEAIRHLIRNCNHTEVYELRGGSDDRVRATLAELNKKFQKFGVVFNTAAITDVRFKKELQDTLQQTTEFQSKIEEENKAQKNEMDKIEFLKNRELNELDKVNKRKIQDLQAARTRVEIARQTDLTDAQGRNQVKVTQANETAAVNEARAASEKDVAAAQGQKAKEEAVMTMRAKDRAARIQTEQRARSNIYDAEQRLLAAKSTAQALEL